MLKNTAQLAHSRHHSINNFIINLVSAITAYSFFDNKLKALNGYEIFKTNQLAFFDFLSRTQDELFRFMILPFFIFSAASVTVSYCI